MTFARRVFFWSGIYGIVALLPLYFLEGELGRRFPPPTNHPEQYYAFLGVALAWQIAFLIMARDPLRYRPLMIPAIGEKLLASGAVIVLLLAGRISGTTAAPLLPDLLLGALFVVSYLKVGKDSPQPTSASPAAERSA